MSEGGTGSEQIVLLVFGGAPRGRAEALRCARSSAAAEAAFARAAGRSGDVVAAALKAGLHLNRALSFAKHDARQPQPTHILVHIQSILQPQQADCSLTAAPPSTVVRIRSPTQCRTWA